MQIFFATPYSPNIIKFKKSNNLIKFSQSKDEIAFTSQFKANKGPVLKAFENNYWDEELLENVQIFKEKNTFGLKEYQNLTEKDKNYLREFVKRDYGFGSIQEDLDDIFKMYDCIKENLDKKYPEGYVFNSIGGSPSVFAKIFEYSNQEAKIFPFSRQQIIPDYKSYFNKLGLTKNYINNCDKKLVFTDYALSGETLRFFKSKMENADLTSEKTVFFPIQDLITKTNSAKKIDNPFETINRFFYKRVIKSYSPSPQMFDGSGYSFNNIELAEKDFNWSVTTKLMQFAIIDKLFGNN